MKRFTALALAASAAVSLAAAQESDTAPAQPADPAPAEPAPTQPQPETPADPPPPEAHVAADLGAIRQDACISGQLKMPKDPSDQTNLPFHCRSCDSVDVEVYEQDKSQLISTTNFKHNYVREQYVLNKKLVVAEPAGSVVDQFVPARWTPENPVPVDPSEVKSYTTDSWRWVPNTQKTPVYAKHCRTCAQKSLGRDGSRGQLSKDNLWVRTETAKWNWLHDRRPEEWYGYDDNTLVMSPLFPDAKIHASWLKALYPNATAQTGLDVAINEPTHLNTPSWKTDYDREKFATRNPNVVPLLHDDNIWSKAYNDRTQTLLTDYGINYAGHPDIKWIFNQDPRIHPTGTEEPLRLPRHSSCSTCPRDYEMASDFTRSEQVSTCVPCGEGRFANGGKKQVLLRSSFNSQAEYIAARQGASASISGSDRCQSCHATCRRCRVRTSLNMRYYGAMGVRKTETIGVCSGWDACIAGHFPTHYQDTTDPDIQTHLNEGLFVAESEADVDLFGLDKAVTLWKGKVYTSVRCLPCPAGSYSPDGSRENGYKTAEENSVANGGNGRERRCLPCPMGTWSAPGSSKCEPWHPSCVSCRNGSGARECTSCPVGSKFAPINYENKDLEPYHFERFSSGTVEGGCVKCGPGVEVSPGGTTTHCVPCRKVGFFPYNPSDPEHQVRMRTWLPDNDPSAGAGSAGQTELAPGTASNSDSPNHGAARQRYEDYKNPMVSFYAPYKNAGDGMYDPGSTATAVCATCHPSCADCEGEGPERCTKCHAGWGYDVVRAQRPRRMQCVQCGANEVANADVLTGGNGREECRACATDFWSPVGSSQCFPRQGAIIAPDRIKQRVTMHLGEMQTISDGISFSQKSVVDMTRSNFKKLAAHLVESYENGVESLLQAGESSGESSTASTTLSSSFALNRDVPAQVQVIRCHSAALLQGVVGIGESQAINCCQRDLYTSPDYSAWRSSCETQGFRRAEKQLTSSGTLCSRKVSLNETASSRRIIGRKWLRRSARPPTSWCSTCEGPRRV